MVAAHSARSQTAGRMNSGDRRVPMGDKSKKDKDKHQKQKQIQQQTAAKNALAKQPAKVFKTK